MSTEAVLDALTTEMTASQVADRLGEPDAKPTRVVPILNSLRTAGRVIRSVDVEGTPVARWRTV